MTLSDQKLKELERALEYFGPIIMSGGGGDWPGEAKAHFENLKLYAAAFSQIAPLLKEMMEKREKATQGEWRFIPVKYDFDNTSGYGQPGIDESACVIIPEDFQDDSDDRMDTVEFGRSDNAEFTCCAANTATEIGRIVKWEK